MNSNSVAKEIEKQTGLKRSGKTKKYAQECGRGNICYAYRFAGYRYSGDFHVAKDYGNTFEVITDSPEGESKLNDILQVLNNLGLEIVTQGRTHIGFKIPEDENKWYGADGSYHKGKWHLYKNYGRDGEYKLYNSEDENSVYNITAYSPSQAKYSADYFIEQFEKGEIMNSKNQTVVRQGPNLKTLDETPAEHIMKNLDAYKGYTRYDMEQLVLNPSGYTLYDGDNRNAVYKKDGAEDITLLFRNGELKDAKITSSRKPIKSEIVGNETSDKFIIVGEDDSHTDVNGHFRRFYWNEDKKRFLISLSDATEYDTKDEAAYELQNHIPNRYNDQFRFFSIERKTSLKPQIYESRKPIKSSQAKLHLDNMEDVRERLEQSVTQSSVETLYDGEDCFITVTQKNYETGNKSEWSFVVDFGTNKVQMLEPTEDEEGFTSDNEIYRIIKNFLNGGMSREKRMNIPDYNPGEPINITGKGNKIGSSKQSSMPRYNDEGKIWSDSLDEYVWEKVKYKDGDTYHWDDVNSLYWNDNGDESDYLMITTEESLPKNCTPIKNSRKAIKSAKTLCKKGSAKLIEHCEAGEYGYLGRYTIIVNGEEVFNFTAENRREAVCSFNNYLDHKINNHINNSRKPIKSSLSDVNKALGFPDNDVEEDGKIHITTDFGEFVVDYVNDEYIVTYDGEERTFTEYKDTVKEVVDLFNQLCNEEIKLFNENINSSKSIKSSKSVCVGFNTENGTLLWKRDDLYTLDGSSIRQTKQKDIADKWIEKYNLNTTDTERLDKYTQEGIGQIPWGLPLVEDKDQTNYNKKLASILPTHGVNSSYGNNPLPTERDYRDFVDKLNNYCKDMKFSYGPMYEFEYEPEEGMSNDGWGHEYPNFRIYDTQGNLDMFSDDSIVKYIRNELKKKGWYPEAVHSSSDFTIAVE